MTGQVLSVAGGRVARFVQEGGYAIAQTNEAVATVLWQVATSETPALRYQTSDHAARLVGVKLKDLDGQRVTTLLARWIRESPSGVEDAIPVLLPCGTRQTTSTMPG